MNVLTTLIIGFSVIAAGVLYVTYALFLHNINKSPRALITAALLLLGLSFLQLGHLEYINTGVDPLDSLDYRFWLFLTPPMFYLFSRSILFEETRFLWSSLLHIAPLVLIFVTQVEISISILFCIGTGYSLWLTQVIYNLRSTRERSSFELFFAGLFSIMAITVLVLGFSLPYMDVGYFYYSYAVSIGLALILVVGVLLSFPHLLTELAEVAKLSYATSTLTDVDIEAKKRQLEDVMVRDKLYEDEQLTLSGLA
ncbi:MAG: hypothetical protein AAF525_05050, partial [Pseudomonadota bacterium]